MIPLPDAVGNRWAVVVKAPHAALAQWAVLRAQRPLTVARAARVEGQEQAIVCCALRVF